MKRDIHYTISVRDAAAHLFHVRLEIAAPDEQGQRLSLPTWIPGSYMIREFARNIVRLQAKRGRRAVALTQLDKHTWVTAPGRGALTIEAQVYAWDLSVRAAHLDESHGFFNPSSLCLAVVGQEDAPLSVTLIKPRGPNFKAWRVGTAMKPAAGTREFSFGTYHCTNYDELIDHPVELGSFTQARFVACGVPHDVLLTGKHDCDTTRLTYDLKKVCEAQIRFWHGARVTKREVPFKRYVFMAMVTGDGYGGLEHRASTALMVARNDLPHAGLEGMSDGYRQVLGLFSHEYFHTWNVKRLKPRAFAPYDLARENHTRLLWFFEGFTSYYDDLFLVRSGVISRADYFATLGKTIQNVLRTPGRVEQSVADASFNAWTKYYRQDENAPNALVSYYTKGSLVALALDAQLRSSTAGRVNLDTLMHALWRSTGQHFESCNAAVEEDGVADALLNLPGLTPAARRAALALLRSATESTEDLPLPHLLKALGLTLAVTTPAEPALGARTAAASDGVKLTQVLKGGGAMRAGLSAGDVLIAIDSLKVTQQNLATQLKRKVGGARVTVHAFRRDELIVKQVTLGAAEVNVNLSPTPKPGAQLKRLQDAWLK